MSNETDGDFREYLNQMNEARRIEQEERKIRYAGHKDDKLKHRANVERTATKLCAAIDAVLASALAGTTTALQAAENYAEVKPFGLSALNCQFPATDFRHSLCAPATMAGVQKIKPSI